MSNKHALIKAIYQSHKAICQSHLMSNIYTLIRKTRQKSQGNAIIQHKEL